MKRGDKGRASDPCGTPLAKAGQPPNRADGNRCGRLQALLWLLLALAAVGITGVVDTPALIPSLTEEVHRGQ